MQHFIWVTAPDGAIVNLLASMVVCFSRHPSGHTCIELNNRQELLVKTRPEELEKRLNKFYDDLLEFMDKRSGL
jgi:hypothetical protein